MSQQSGCFTLDAQCGHARAGHLRTAHALVPTPAFMPVATQGAVKSIDPHEVSATGARMVIMNTYHLWLRPGVEVVGDHGGLHQFTRWPHAIVTDSGGFQAFSLAERVKISEEGFAFRSHLDGAALMLSPEESMRVQGGLGADIAMQLDVCPPADASSEVLREAVGVTTRWARRCLAVRLPQQLLFGIVQGGLDLSLRLRHASELMQLDLDGIALGGFSVGEPNEAMHRTLMEVAPTLDAGRPHYLMGVGTPSDLIRAVGAGVDIFDCVMPTRNARNGQAFTSYGKIVIKNAKYRSDLKPLEEGCSCPCCNAGFSRAFLRHAYIAGEIGALRLITLHNLHYYAALMRNARQAIERGVYSEWAAEALSKLAST